MNMSHGCVGLGLLAIGFAVPASAMTEAEFQAAADGVFAAAVAQYDIPGLAVGVTWQGRQYVYTTGLADRKAATPVSADTLFELGSISKLFNATLAALAERQHRLSLADPTSRHFPALKGSAFDAISLMDLATHQTGGLPVQVPNEVKTDASLLDWLGTWRPLAGAGHERSYSNISIGLLGRASAKTYGRPYAEALRDEVLTPLGLESTYVQVPPSQAARYAQGYSREGNRPVRVNPGLLDAEAYGVKSDLGDMLRFLQVQLGDIKVSEDLRWAIARTREGQTRTAYFTQAMIWERYPWPVPRDQLVAGNSPAMAMKSQPAQRLGQAEATNRHILLNKTGSTNGFGGYVALLPDEDLGIALLVNRPFPTQVRADLTRTLIETLLGK